MTSRSLSPPRAPILCRLGILGSRQDLTASDITCLLDLIVEDVGTIHTMYLPQEGYSSIYAESWAEQHYAGVEVLAADWIRYKKSAKAIRDGRIIQCGTHFLIFGAPRSSQPLKVAHQLARKGRPVYYLAHGSRELEEITATEIDHTLYKGKAHSQQKEPAQATLTTSGQLVHP